MEREKYRYKYDIMRVKNTISDTIFYGSTVIHV